MNPKPVYLLLTFLAAASQIHGATFSWQFGKSEILENEQFLVEIVSREINFFGGGEPYPAMRVKAALSPDDRMLMLASGGGPGIGLNLDNPESSAALKSLLLKYEPWKRESGDYAIKNGDTWRTSLGSRYGVEATRQASTVYRKDTKLDFFTYCSLRLTDQTGTFEILDTGAYLFALESIPQLIKMHQDALAGRDAEIAKRVQAEAIARQAKIAAARAESVQRLREAEAAQRSMERDAETEAELKRIAKAEDVAKSKSKQMDSAEKARRVAEVLAKPDGTPPEEHIKTLSNETSEKLRAETNGATPSEAPKTGLNAAFFMIFLAVAGIFLFLWKSSGNNGETYIPDTQIKGQETLIPDLNKESNQDARPNSSVPGVGDVSNAPPPSQPAAQTSVPHTTVQPVTAFNLKCSGCGAALQIPADLERFSCGYCGCQLIVRRSGGTVSLAPLEQAVAHVHESIVAGEPQSTEIFAIICFGTGLVGLWALPIIFTPVTFVTSIVSSYRLKENPHLKGKGLRITGTILGSVSILWMWYQSRQV